ncbi:carboxylate-amine ligase [Nonomuraea sp. LPB2021202275-12-8]|uniref:carboxylate-amine ligase n=1 Tax=Nonomuraea sp. LPB2021202275-12-8 TaxID=3120159 RepID=UPI00300D159B
MEEEFFLIDPRSGRTTPRAEPVLGAVPPELRRLVQREFAACQVEVASSPHVNLEPLHAELALLRVVLARAARAAGCRLVAAGVAPLEHSASNARITDDARYQRMAAEYGAIARGEHCCGCHVHVEVADDEEAVQVCNHLRPRLPVLHSLTVNSPFSGGADSGYGSWRSVALTRWPSVGLPPYFESAADYRATVAALIRSGMILDEAMVYWLVRRSHHLPTVEIRVADVCATASEAVLLAAVVRALVSTILSDVRAGVPAPRHPEPLLRAAYWRAAHDGLEGDGLDVRSADRIPAWRLVDTLIRDIGPALTVAGDLDRVTCQLAELRAGGSGAARQRAAYARRHDLLDVISSTTPEPGGR